MQNCLLLALAVLATPPDQPKLGHSAPFLGHTLEFHVRDAPASQPVALLYSPNAGHSTTPFGVMEIERVTAQQVATGVTDASGEATLSISIPADPALAENEAHYQAMITDPSLPAGAVLSKAVHLRLLGSRVYAEYAQNLCGTGRRGIMILDAIHDRNSVEVDLGTQSGCPNWLAAMVFSPDMARGVVSTATGLVFFDPFFGGVIDAIQIPNRTGEMLVDASGEHMLVMESGDFSGAMTFIHSVDFDTGRVVHSFGLPIVAGSWCTNDARTEAFIVEKSSAQVDAAVRRVDLVTWTDLGSVPIGAVSPTSQRVMAMEWANSWLFVASRTAFDQSAFTRIDYSGPTPVATVQSDSVEYLRLAAVPAADRVLITGRDTTSSALAQGAFRSTTLSAPGPLVSIPVTPSGLQDEIGWWLAVDGASVWVLDMSGDQCVFMSQCEGGQLLRADMTTGAWSSIRWWREPNQVAVMNDAFVHKVCVATSRFFVIPGYWWDLPEVTMIGASGQSSTDVRQRYSTYALKAVPVP